VSLNGVIASLRTTKGGNPDGTYTVIRTATGTRDRGRYTPGAVTTFTIIAGIEPVTGRELKDLPEGQRGDEVIAIFTATPILTVRPGFGADRITYRPPGYDGDGEPWTVTKVDVIEGFGEVHYEAQASRAPSPAGVVP
jgi:hypothetical protein